MKRGFYTFVTTQLSRVPPIEPVDLSGQTVCVVGANVGLGFEAAKHFARMKPSKLILCCRTVEKGEGAKNEIQKETSFDRIEIRTVDLAQFSSTKAFATKLAEEEPRLDILIMNAAVASFTYSSTYDDWETMLQVNYLSTSLASLLLLPLLEKTAKEHSVNPRLVIVSSGSHYRAVHEKAYETEGSGFMKVLSTKEYCTPKVMRNRYNISKLFGVFFVRSLHTRLGPNSPVVVNLADPGFCYSALRREASGVIYALMRMYEVLFARSTEEGSRQLVWASICGDPQELKGAYVSSMRVEEVSDFVLSEEGGKFQERLWNETMEILSKEDPRVEQIVQGF